MKICYIADGKSLHTQRWLNYFARKGHEVHLVCWKMIPGFDINIHIHLLGKVVPKSYPGSQIFNFIRLCIEIRRIVRKIKPQIIDGHFVTIYGFIAALSNFHPLVVTAWGSDILIFAKKNLIFRFMATFAMKKADVIVCTAAIVKNEISSLSIDPNKIHIIVIGGIDKYKFYPAEKNLALLDSLSISQNEPVIISTRTLEPIYDVATLIKAAPLILSEIPTAKFIIIGKGKLECYLRKIATNLHVDRNIVFTGWIPHDELPVYLSSSDIYISTSLSDGTSNCLLEAMACELAPVVTDIPANRQWIKDSENGLFFRVRDHIMLAKKVVWLLKNQQVGKDFGSLCRQTIEMNADPEIEMQRLQNIYSASIK
jgi:L-malate glycosyltransferase